MEFPEFCLMMIKKMSECDTENEIQEAYRHSFIHYLLLHEHLKFQ